MRSLLILLTGPFMMVILIAGVQTIEWHLNDGTPVPLPAYLLLLIVGLWCLLAATTKKRDMEKSLRLFERWLDKLFK